MKFSTKSVSPVLLAAVVLAPSAPSFAHVSLLEKEAAAGSAYTAAFRVGHACAGAAATTAIAVQLPAGFKLESAEPRVGWVQSTQTAVLKNGPLARPARVSWVSSSPEAVLSAKQSGDFVLRGTLPAATGPLWFKVLQTCDVGSVDWAQVPASGVSSEALARPAARLEVMPAGFVAATVAVREAWIRATVPGQRGTGAFMKFTAKSATRLVGISTSVAGVAEVHEMKMEGDIMRMRPLTDGLELPAGKTVELKSGGYHLMLMDLKQGLANGSKVPLMLTFKDGKGVESTMEVSVPVSSSEPRGAGAKAADHSVHQH